MSEEEHPIRKEFGPAPANLTHVAASILKEKSEALPPIMARMTTMLEYMAATYPGDCQWRIAYREFTRLQSEYTELVAQVGGVIGVVPNLTYMPVHM